MGAADFRVGGRVFATLAHGRLGLGNLACSPLSCSKSLIAEAPDVFLPRLRRLGAKGTRTSAWPGDA